MQLMDVTIVNGRVRHPQSQGLVEQANGTVKRMLTTWTIEHTEGWSAAIPFVQCMVYIFSQRHKQPKKIFIN
jgi:hypothetical protein